MANSGAESEPQFFAVTPKYDCPHLAGCLENTQVLNFECTMKRKKEKAAAGICKGSC